MATAAKSASKGAAQMDQKAKMKLILASVVLAVAVVWIIFYLSSLGGGSGPVSLSPEEKAVVEEQHTQELEKVKEETNKSYRGGKPPGPPGSS